MLPTRCFSLAVTAAAALSLTGCMTPQAKVAPSQAVLDARAHRNVVEAPDCANLPLSAVSPTRLGFAFDGASLDETVAPSLERPAAWLACHPGVPAVIKPDADNHGPEAEQDTLARRRGEAVAGYLRAQGVPPARVQVLRRGQSEPAGQHLLILAEGRRW